MASGIELGILGTIGGILGLAYYSEWLIKKLRNGKRRLDNFLASELPFDVGLYVLVGNAFLSSEDIRQDSKHRIIETEQSVDLTGDATDVENIEYFKGQNLAEDPSEGFVFYLESETFLDGDAVSAKQISDDGEEDIEVNIRHQPDDFSAIFEAEFVEPVEQYDEFEIEITSHLGDWSLSNGQYIFYDLDRFHHGLDYAECKAILGTPPTVQKCYRATNKARLDHTNDPLQLDFEIQEVELDSDEDNCEFKYSVTDAKDTILVMEFGWG